MAQSVTQLRAAWRIVAAKPKQIKRLLLPPFLLAMAVKAWLSVQVTGQVWPDLPVDASWSLDLALRGSLGLALAVMGLLWHRAIFFGPRARLTANLALRYWGQGAALSLLALLPFVPLVIGGLPPHAIFAADAVSLWLLLWLGFGLTRAAGGKRAKWGKLLDRAQAGIAAGLALALAVALQLQTFAVAAVVQLHSGAAFLLDGALTFALIVAVLTLMARPSPAN
ncbi:MAG: hypothetical protein HLUCCA05_03975 [Roseibaca calidilacus]|uniref:Uncharacterized protein n=1 Tax=Roseibaca calidilacus TaxID=1666912 RepID=A0A0P7WPB2_9RHOB|nr:MAG: hypothetical protein HLUCCA05_03975 [Roseibaca calidilacus]CUX81629.1 hypothetical protein Ga0058931_1880 [Roseibaca calidilacus]